MYNDKISFLIGLAFLIGFQQMYTFFTKKNNIKGSIFFLIGFIILVLTYYSFIAFCIESYGLFQLFMYAKSENFHGIYFYGSRIYHSLEHFLVE